MRGFWGADVVMYLTDFGGAGISGLSDQPNYKGLPLPGPGTDYGPWASSALQYNCSLFIVGPGPVCYDNTVFAHEFAHNLGANHDLANSPWPTYPTMYTPPGPLLPSAFGYSWNVRDDSGYRTVMAYTTPDCTAPCIRLPYFSNSAVNTSDGHATGVAETKENAVIIKANAPYAALYQASKGRIFYNGFEGVL